MILPKVTHISTPYTAEIRGYGELYEIESVRHVQRSIQKTPYRYLFTAPNIVHNGKFGMTAEGLVKIVTEYYGAKIHSQGFTDTPPWKSFRQSEVHEIHFIKQYLARVIFWFMVYFEKSNPVDSHMVYVIADTTKPIKAAPDIENTNYWKDEF